MSLLVPVSSVPPAPPALLLLEGERTEGRKKREVLHLFRCYTHRGFYTRTLLHTDTFTHMTLLHTETFTQKRFYTQTLLDTNAFRHRDFYTQTLLHTDAFTQKLLHTDAFTHRSFYTQKLLHTSPDNLEIAILPQFLKGLCGTP